MNIKFHCKTFAIQIFLSPRMTFDFYITPWEPSPKSYWEECLLHAFQIKHFGKYWNSTYFQSECLPYRMFLSLACFTQLMVNSWMTRKMEGWERGRIPFPNQVPCTQNARTQRIPSHCEKNCYCSKTSEGIRWRRLFKGPEEQVVKSFSESVAQCLPICAIKDLWIDDAT